MMGLAAPFWFGVGCFAILGSAIFFFGMFVFAARWMIRDNRSDLVEVIRGWVGAQRGTDSSVRVANERLYRVLDRLDRIEAKLDRLQPIIAADDDGESDPDGIDP